MCEGPSGMLRKYVGTVSGPISDAAQIAVRSVNSRVHGERMVGV